MHAARLVPVVPREPRLFHGAPRRLLRRGVAVRRSVDGRELPPRPRECGVISLCLEHRDRRGRLLEDPLVPGGRIRRPQEGEPENAERGRAVDPSEPHREIDRRADGLVRLLEAAHLDVRVAEVAAEIDPARVVVRKERDRAVQEVRGRGHVAALERPAPGDGELTHGAGAETTRPLVRRRELYAIAIRLLEVVADGLLEMHVALTDGLLEPLDVPLVEVGPDSLQLRVVCGLADQDVLEAVRIVFHEDRWDPRDEKLARKEPQVVVDDRTHGIGGQVRDRAPVEDGAGDRSGLEHDALLPAKPVEPRGEERRDRRRNGDRARPDRPPSSLIGRERALVDEHGDHLLGEERVALRGLRDPGTHLRREPRAPEQLLSHAAGLLLREGRQQDALRALVPLHPARAILEQLGTCRAYHQERSVLGRLDDVLDEIQERRLGPVDVFDDDHQRAPARELLQHLAGRPEGLADRERLVREAEDRGQARDDVRLPRHQRRELRSRARYRLVLGDLSGLPHDLGKGRERDAVAVRDAPAAERVRLARRPREELVDETGLAEPGVAEHGHEPTASLVLSAQEAAVKDRELLRPAHQRGVEEARESLGAVGTDAQGGDTRALARSCPSGRAARPPRPRPRRA